MRTVRKVYDAAYSLIRDLVTYSPLPTPELDQVDPFLLLNHHGPQEYPSNNDGLPFGPHPHRGIETVTFIVGGDILHRDTDGHHSLVTAGGVQWMTAGRGLIHAETSSDTFKKKGGNLEILQLWINLPSRLKMNPPFYKGAQREEIPVFVHGDGKVQVHIVSGTWGGQQGMFESLTGVELSTIDFVPGGRLRAKVPRDRNILFYVIAGRLTVNGQQVKGFQLAEFENDADEIDVVADEISMLLFGHAKPFGEPVVADGPFVMNTEDEIRQAYADYRQGKFGRWRDQ